MVQVGDEIEVYILRLDHKRKRVSLSLKRTIVSLNYLIEQLSAHPSELFFGEPAKPRVVPETPEKKGGGVDHVQ